MLLNTAAVAAPSIDSSSAHSASFHGRPTAAPPPRHSYILSPLETFGPYVMYLEKWLSPCATHVHPALIDMRQRRVIGKHAFSYIDLDEVTQRLGSKDVKHISQGARELQDKGVWRQEGGVWCPATDVEQLHIETRHRYKLRRWLASLTGRRSIIVPRVLYEALPRLSASQMALRLELLTRSTWTGDKAETTASIDLHLDRLAARWGLTARTFHSALKNPGDHLQLIREDTSGQRVRERGRRYRVIVRRPEGKAGDEISSFSRAETVDEISGISAKAGDEISSFLNGSLSLNPLSYERDLKPSTPPDAAQGQDTGACQPLEEIQDSKDKTVTTVQDIDVLPADTVDSWPADPEPEGEDVTPAQDLDTSPANTTDLPPADPEPKPEPTPTAAPEPDWQNLIPADLIDLARLSPLYDQAAKRGHVTRCFASWLMFVTAAMYTLGKDNIQNRPAYFRRIIEDGDHSAFRQSDEDKALALIKAHEPPSFIRDLHLVPKAPALSPDAELVARVQRVLTLNGYKGDVFHGLKHFDEGHDWTRQRFDTAVAELATPPKPAYLPPAVTLPGLPLYRSELRDIEPADENTGLPPPPAEPAVQATLEAAPAEEENMAMSDWLPQLHEPLPGGPRVSLKYLSDEADLRHNETLIALFAEASGEGRVIDDDAGILKFFAAAEHALYVQGVTDRPALFRRIVRQGKWGLITPEAEARAHQRLDRLSIGGSIDVSL